MTLDPARQQKLSAWLNSKGIQLRCAACSNMNWQAGDVIASPIMNPGGMQIGGPTVPMVQLICNYCGYVALFAAVPMELI